MAAARRSMAARHTIWEIVAHVAAELRYAVELIEDTAGPWLEGQTTWPAVDEVSDAAWASVLGEVGRDHQALVDAIFALDDADLDRRSERVGRSFYDLLHGVIAHNVYHAGQIRLMVHSGRRLS